MRGFGNPEGSTVLHTIFELVADVVGKDSLEVKKNHLWKSISFTFSGGKEIKKKTERNQILLNKLR